ncbi:MAG: exodeoxyribonuclease V subunit alpha [Actinobacteria bacterium]|nr:exodeoxyribonuclease V subunit alpha [Actinomycetota bacterium]
MTTNERAGQEHPATDDAVDPLSCGQARGATGLLATFNRAGVLDAADVHVAQRLTTMAAEPDQRVALAVALAVRALRAGSVCVDLRAAETHIGTTGLPWPVADDWLAAVRASPLTGNPPVLRLRDDLLYLDRYWREEQQVADDVLAMLGTRPPDPVPDFGGLFPPGFDEQRRAAQIASTQRLTVLTGGPGTGKTTTVARLLALLAEQAELSGRARLRIALAAPTGKAAARLHDAVLGELDALDGQHRRRLDGLRATTLHRLLGSRSDSSSRFRHHRENRLPHDVVVVDETSMVSLTMMARLLEAVRPDTRLLLVGDADQLASVEAGAVLADLVDGLGTRGDAVIASLRTSHRFGRSIGRLATAIRAGDADRVVELLRAGDEHVEWVHAGEPQDFLRAVLVPQALELRGAALRGDVAAALSALAEHRLLCAHRRGPFGVTHWNRQIERWVSEATGEAVRSAWYPGRPVLVTSNEHGLGLYNGDAGVTMVVDGELRVVIAGAGGAMEFTPGRLADVETMHAMTIHKSQGSQADDITVLLPPEDSRLLTRELFYTAVTRAKNRVRVVAAEAAVRAAVDRRAMRASGLRGRLRA